MLVQGSLAVVKQVRMFGLMLLPWLSQAEDIVLPISQSRPAMASRTQVCGGTMPSAPASRG